MGGGIYAAGLKSFAQNAAERVSRTHELAEFVETRGLERGSPPVDLRDTRP